MGLFIKDVRNKRGGEGGGVLNFGHNKIKLKFVEEKEEMDRGGIKNLKNLGRPL